MPRNSLSRIRWAQVLQMAYEDLKDKYIICRLHFSATEIVTNEDGSEVLGEKAVPLPWNGNSTLPSSSQPSKCKYIQENPYPDTPLNTFAKEQMDYMAEVQPDLKYGELKSKIEEEWKNLSEDERYFYTDTSKAQEEEWNREHDKSHGECPIRPRDRSFKTRKRKATDGAGPSSKKIVKTTEVDLSLFTLAVKTEDQTFQKELEPKRNRRRRRGKGAESDERKEKRLKRLREQRKRKSLEPKVKKEEGTKQEEGEVKKEEGSKRRRKGRRRKSEGPKQELKSEIKTEEIQLKPELIENL